MPTTGAGAGVKFIVSPGSVALTNAAGLADASSLAPKVCMYQACISLFMPAKCRWCDATGAVCAFISSSSTFMSSGAIT